MPTVKVQPGEPFDIALKKFKRQCERDGILSDIKKKEHYEKPSVRKKKKIIAARKKAMKRQRGPRS